MAASVSQLYYFCIILLFCMKLGFASDDDGAYISYSALNGHRDRQLTGGAEPLECEIDVNKINMRPLRRLCQAPLYPARNCCRGFQVVACRYYNHLNNQSTLCATDLFACIGQKGRYPFGLFRQKCVTFGHTNKGVSCEGYLGGPKPKPRPSINNIVRPLLPKNNNVVPGRLH